MNRLIRRARIVAVVTVAMAAIAPTGGGPAGESANTIGRPSPAFRAALALPHPATFVVRARRAADLDAVAARANANGYTISQRVEAPPALQLTPPGGVGITAAITAFTSKTGVLYAEPNHPIAAADVPTDPLYAKQSPYLTVEHAPEAWDVEKGKPGVVVAVLDTGIDITHPDLHGRIWTNPAESANGADDDNNGCVDDVHGCAFVTDPSPGCARPASGDVRDDRGHGTFVSGIIAADGGNGIGIVGVARGVTIMPVKVLDCHGDGSTFTLARGILYAARNGASVINISLGGTIDSAFLREAVRIAHDEYRVLIVAAAGNDGASVAYPARYPGVLAVAATSGANPGVRAPFSGFGPEISVVAVGEGIVGTVPPGSCKTFLPCIARQDGYAIGDGTSFSAAQVTGLVALMLSRNPRLAPDQIVSVIKSAADGLPAGDHPNWSGAGLINMFKAVHPQFRIGVPGTTRG